METVPISKSKTPKRSDAFTVKYKCSRCETVGEAVTEARLACSVCGTEMLQIKEGEELKREHGRKIDGLPEAKVVSLGFYDLLPIPAGSKLDMFRQKLQDTKLTNTIQEKNSSHTLKMLEEITYNPINDDITGNYKKQRRQQVRFYSLLAAACFALLFILLLRLI